MFLALMMSLRLPTPVASVYMVRNELYYPQQRAAAPTVKQFRHVRLLRRHLPWFRRPLLNNSLAGSIADFDLVQQYINGCAAVVHTTILFQGNGIDASGKRAPGEFADDQNHAELPWLVNLKGLWNALECAQKSGCRRVVRIGSCHHEWPGVAHLQVATCFIYAWKRHDPPAMPHWLFKTDALRSLPHPTLLFRLV